MKIYRIDSMPYMHHNDFVVTLDPLMKGALKGRKWQMSFKQFQEKINFFLSIIFKKKLI